MEWFPGLKSIAVDFVSYSDQDDGSEARCTIYLGKDCHFICDTEDVNMQRVLDKKLRRVMALPLLVEDLDIASVTMMAEFE